MDDFLKIFEETCGEIFSRIYHLEFRIFERNFEGISEYILGETPEATH